MTETTDNIRSLFALYRSYLTGGETATRAGVADNETDFARLIGLAAKTGPETAGRDAPDMTATMRPALRELYDHPLLGHDEDGKPIVAETEAERAETLARAREGQAARGEDAEDVTCILGKLPVHDGSAGLIGYTVRTLVALTGLRPTRVQGRAPESLPART